MPIKSPEVDLANALAASSLWSPMLVVGTDIKFGQPIDPTIPGSAGIHFWVMPYGGIADPMENAGVEGSYRHSYVQVLVLSKPLDLLDGLTNARKVRAALHTKAIAGYSRVTARSGSAEPNQLGTNSAGQYRMAINFDLEWNGPE